mgnify:CR=1 FL=1
MGRQAARLIGLNAYADYLVRSPVEITSVLRSLQKGARQITAYFDDSPSGFLATTIVSGPGSGLASPPSKPASWSHSMHRPAV